MMIFKAQISKKTTVLLVVAAVTTSASTASTAPLRFTEACSPHTNIEIVAVGDVLLHSPLQKQAVSHTDRFKSLCSAVIPYVQRADILMPILKAQSPPT
jgi:hypothetical protein